MTRKSGVRLSLYRLRFSGVLFLIGILGACASQTQTISVSVSPQTAFVGSSQTTQFTANVMGDNSGVAWSVNGTPGGSSTVGTIDAQGNYSAPAVTQNTNVTITATSKKDMTKSGSASLSIVAPGQVASTNNPQVALYTIAPPADAMVSIQFGTDTNYGLTTWALASPAGGGPTSIYVAGMLPNTLYHMRAIVQFGSATVDDSDHTFTTSALPAGQSPTVTATTTAGTTPQSGVELLDFFSTAKTGQVSVAVTDLSGNVLWGFAPNLNALYGPNPVKMLPDGNFLMNFSGSNPDGVNSVLEEVDLGGNIIWQMSAADLNQALAAATCAGCNITVLGTHHDVAILPNGHLVVIAAEDVSETGLTGEPSPTTVTGDVLIDLDQNRKPVWVWSSFDHLDLNRHPMSFPDWTHTNSIVYSADDKDLIISMRHQHWVMKIDYNDGQGTGNILWKLGYQGDFTLMNGTAPQDWTYAQHDANVITSNSSGTFEMTMFDNGNNRVLNSGGTVCGAPNPACFSRVPIYQLDETAKTATLEWVDDLSPVFSFFGGNAGLLANGNMEFDECGLTTPADNSAIYEVTQTMPPQVVWQMQIAGQYAYRGFRMPSLYPGVQW
ncbi:MAG TPA: aryl-sulfate sulfotransferase [Candidatus Limnocylindrales bacterium]|nr:aryl-sulfate sulfotransferase [Candidatus Limnocylindrales bacterium]